LKIIRTTTENNLDIIIGSLDNLIKEINLQTNQNKSLKEVKLYFKKLEEKDDLLLSQSVDQYDNSD
jgi:hypothetical protein